MKTPNLSSQNHLELCQWIRQRICEHPERRITFAEYMDWVLYHPKFGYYSTNQVKIGKEGDFFTAANLGQDFGELIAEQLLDFWQILGQPSKFSVIEVGAGKGLVSLDILEYLQTREPCFYDSIEYWIVEKSSELINVQQATLQAYTNNQKILWKTWEQIPDHTLTGCVFSNELIDAFPVHQITLNQGQLQEVYVTLDDNSQFTEMFGELSDKQLEDYLELVKIKIQPPYYLDGYRSEINLAALDWIKTVTSKLNRGYLLTIDYGYPASRYYAPHRNKGTLQCYYRHHRHDYPYINIGYQDITAHVDFTALEYRGEQLGLTTVGLTQQGLFLMALGLGDRLSALSSSKLELTQILQRRDAMHQLIDPMGLGGFCVLIQSRGLTPLEKQYPVRGLTVPKL